MRAGAVLVVVVLIGMGCASRGKLNTPSGRPEVHILGATPEEVSALCVQHLQKEGFSLEETTAYTVRGVSGDPKIIWSGSVGWLQFAQGSYEVLARVTFNITKVEAGATVYASLFAVTGGSRTQFGSPNERAMECGRQDHFDALQGRLESIREAYLQSKGTAAARPEVNS
jgi:hypothetical protein